MSVTERTMDDERMDEWFAILQYFTVMISVLLYSTNTSRHLKKKECGDTGLKSFGLCSIFPLSHVLASNEMSIFQLLYCIIIARNASSRSKAVYVSDQSFIIV